MSLAHDFLDIIDKRRNLLEMSRQDLCFAIQYACDNDHYRRRLFGTVLAITRELNDKDKFIEYMKVQEMNCPECRNYIGKCEIHGL